MIAKFTFTREHCYTFRKRQCTQGHHFTVHTIMRKSHFSVTVSLKFKNSSRKLFQWGNLQDSKINIFYALSGIISFERSACGRYEVFQYCRRWIKLRSAAQTPSATPEFGDGDPVLQFVSELSRSPKITWSRM